MHKIVSIIFLAVTIVQICHSAPSEVPVDAMTVDEMINYYQENTIFYFYPKVPAIKSYIEAILHLVDESAVQYTANDQTKAKTYQYIREYIVEILINLKRRDDGCDIHRNLIMSLHAIRYLIEDTADQELLVEFKKQKDAMDMEIEWPTYYRQAESALRDIEDTCYQNGCEAEFQEKLLLKLC